MTQTRRQKLSLGENGSITSVSPCHLSLERKGRCEILPSSLDQAAQIGSERADFGKNSRPLLASASVYGRPAAGSRVSEVPGRVSS